MLPSQCQLKGDGKLVGKCTESAGSPFTRKAEYKSGPDLKLTIKPFAVHSMDSTKCLPVLIQRYGRYEKLDEPVAVSWF
jgi:hypothetical protein